MITLFVPLLAFAFLGLFVRYMGDDWCFAAVVNRVGLLEAQRSWYIGWSGRFSFTLASGIAHLFGLRVAPLLPAFMLALWLAAASWATYQIALAARWPRPLLASLLAAELVVFATLNTAHNIVQSFYWQTGALTYLAPLILLTFYVGVVVYGVRRRPEGRGAPLWSLSFVLTFTAGGFAETYACVQTGGLLLAVFACYRGRSAAAVRAALAPVTAGLAGSCLALLVVALSPGNDVRQSFFATPPGLISTAKIALYYATGHAPYTAYHWPGTTLLMLAAPALTGLYLYASDARRRESLDLRDARRLLILLPVAGYILILLCYVPAAYTTATYLPGRARIIPQFVFVCVTAYWGYFAGAALSTMLSARRQFISRSLNAGLVVVMALLILSPLSAAWRVLTLVEGARESAAVFDQMDREIRAAKERGVMNQMVTALDDVETRFGAVKTELHIERDPENWKNKCVARFYEVSSIRTR
ncbi:MAG: DUF6056 family protein [Pyrinomonadaceae bacterium]